MPEARRLGGRNRIPFPRPRYGPARAFLYGQPAPGDRKDAGGPLGFSGFTVREREGKQHIRPISARYMHAKEIRHYAEKEAQETPGPQD
jgi:hypothetical protein